MGVSPRSEQRPTHVQGQHCTASCRTDQGTSSMQKVAMTVVALATAGASESPPLTSRADPWGEIARAARRRCPCMRQSAKLLSLGQRELLAGTRAFEQLFEVLREPLGQLAH